MASGIPLRFKLQVAGMLSIALIGLSACKRQTEQPTQPTETYTETPGTVGLDIIPLAGSEGFPRWMATYSDEGRTTKFTFEFAPIASTEGSSSPAMGRGRLLATPDSQPTPLLNALQKSLQARRMPQHVQRQDELSFGYLLLGDNQSRGTDGSFSPSPKGNWTVTKLFLANDTAEVYFNYNPVIHKAELRIKDAAYGDKILAELAKVF